MGVDAIIVLCIMAVAIVLFATEWISIDLVAILIMVALVLTGVITPQEGLMGFSNPATITVAFMFVLSYALLRTGSLQRIGPALSNLFKSNFNLGILAMMVFIGVCSAFINNTPIVAMFIPVILSVSKMSGISSTKMLIPLSFASIFGGVCTLIGTSTNILVSGIAEDHGLPPFPMFMNTPMGIVFLVAGSVYLIFFANKLLPDRSGKSDLSEKFNLRNYIAEIEVLSGSDFVGTRIMDSIIAREMELEIIEVRREGARFTMPGGDFVIESGDVLKVRCNVEKIKELKDRLKVSVNSSAVKIGQSQIQKGDTSIMELIIATNSEFVGKTLGDVDFRGTYRAVPLAILHREDVVHEHLQDVVLQAGDIVLVEVKSHRVKNLKQLEMGHKSPFVILSEEGMIDFNKRKFVIVLSVIAGVVIAASLNLVPIVIASILGAAILVLTRCINMSEAYNSIEWKIVFLLAGALSLGVGMEKSGLAGFISDSVIGSLGVYGPVAIVSGLYLVTAVLTEIMSNNATAALIAPIAISTADKLDLSPYPFLMAVMFAASFTFMTPIGYQCNTMVYSAGQYKFGDFFRIGVWLSLLFWLLATLLIPVFFPF